MYHLQRVFHFAACSCQIHSLNKKLSIISCFFNVSITLTAYDITKTKFLTTLETNDIFYIA